MIEPRFLRRIATRTADLYEEYGYEVAVDYSANAVEKDIYPILNGYIAEELERRGYEIKGND